MPEKYVSDYDIVDRLAALSEKIEATKDRWMQQVSFLQGVVTSSDNPLPALKCLEEVMEMSLEADRIQVEKMAVMIEKIRLEEVR